MLHLKQIAEADFADSKEAKKEASQPQQPCVAILLESLKRNDLIPLQYLQRDQRLRWHLTIIIAASLMLLLKFKDCFASTTQVIQNQLCTCCLVELEDFAVQQLSTTAITITTVAVGIEATIATEVIIVINITIAIVAITTGVDLVPIISGVVFPGMIADLHRKYYFTVVIVIVVAVAAIAKHIERYQQLLQINCFRWNLLEDCNWSQFFHLIKIQSELH